MSALLDILGIRLFLRMGASIPRPVSYDVISALSEAEVTNDIDGNDSFQLTFTLGRTRSSDFSLISDGTLAPDARVSLGVALGVLPEMLIDGVVERYELTPEGPQRGATVTVHGRSVLSRLDREARTASYDQQSVQARVQSILSTRYTTLLPLTDIRAPEADSSPTAQQLTPQQTNQSDLAYIRDLAQRAGFVFCADYAALVGSTAYFGPRYAAGAPQPTLTYNMGGATNLKSISLANDAMAPVSISQGATLDTSSMSVVTQPGTPATPSGFASTPASPLRSEQLRCVARFDTAQLGALSRAAAQRAPAPVTGSGEIDTLRYGSVLRPNRSVQIRGIGLTSDGQFQVSSVTHALRRGEYAQSFRFLRDGTGGGGA